MDYKKIYSLSLLQFSTAVAFAIFTLVVGTRREPPLQRAGVDAITKTATGGLSVVMGRVDVSVRTANGWCWEIIVAVASLCHRCPPLMCILAVAWIGDDIFNSHTLMNACSYDIRKDFKKSKLIDDAQGYKSKHDRMHWRSNSVQ